MISQSLYRCWATRKILLHGKFSTQIYQNKVKSNKRLVVLTAIFTFVVAIVNFSIRHYIGREISCMAAWRGEPAFSNDPCNWVSLILMTKMGNKKFNTVWNNPRFHLISILVLKITKSNKISDGTYCKSCHLILLMRKRKSNRPFSQFLNILFPCTVGICTYFLELTDLQITHIGAISLHINMPSLLTEV